MSRGREARGAADAVTDAGRRRALLVNDGASRRVSREDGRDARVQGLPGGYSASPVLATKDSTF